MYKFTQYFIDSWIACKYFVLTFFIMQSIRFFLVFFNPYFSFKNLNVEYKDIILLLSLSTKYFSLWHINGVSHNLTSDNVSSVYKELFEILLIICRCCSFSLNTLNTLFIESFSIFKGNILSFILIKMLSLK